VPDLRSFRVALVLRESTETLEAIDCVLSVAVRT
jgi:hypothetical protein